MGIFTVMDLYNSPVWRTKAAFHSIAGYYWFLRLRGYEIDNVEFGRRSYGNSYSLPRQFTTPQELSPILAKLVEKTSFRMRRAGLSARGIHLAILFKGSYWHHGEVLQREIFDSRDVYREALRIMITCPKLGLPVRNLAVSCFGLEKIKQYQLDLFEDIPKKKSLVDALDQVNNRWGEFIITPARMAYTQNYIPDRIAFGNVKELEEFTKINS
jgi:DNA polymerase-4